MPLFAPPNVEKLKKERKVKGLIKALGYMKDDQIRINAAQALGEVGDTRAVEPLITALQDRDSRVRCEAALALGALGDPRAVKPLVTALKDVNQWSRWGAARALRLIAKAVRRAIGTAATSLLGADADVSQFVAGPLQAGHWRVAGEALLAAFQDKDSGISNEALWALAAIGDRRAVEPLITALEDRDVSDAAAASLDTIGWKPGKDEAAARYWIAKRHWENCALVGNAAVEPLITTLHHREWEVRRKAAGALDAIGWKPGKDETAAWYWIAKRRWLNCAGVGDAAVEPLIIKLTVRDWQDRQGAAQALGAIGDGRAVEPLITAYKDTDWITAHGAKTKVLQAITKALCTIGAAAVPPLIARLKDEDYRVRDMAIFALGAIGDGRAVEPLITVFQDVNQSSRWRAAEALGAIGDRRAVEPLITALKDAHSSGCRVVVEALGAIGDGRAVEPLITALQHWDKDVREAAGRVLVGLYNSEALNDAQKEEILGHRHTITEETHTDYTSRCMGHHDVGIDFPL